MPDNLLYYGDPGAPGLRRHGKDESVDLVYLDRALFNGDPTGSPCCDAPQSRKVLPVGSPVNDQDYPGAPGPKAFHEVVQAGGRVAQAMIAFRTFLGENPAAPGLADLANTRP